MNEEEILQPEQTAPPPEEQAPPEACVLEERERELTRRETRLAALGELEARSLPPELLDVLPLESGEGMRGALERVEAAFRRAVEATVQKKLAGAPPILSGTGPDAHELALRRALGLKA